MPAAIGGVLQHQVLDDIVFIDAEFFGLFRYLLVDHRRVHKSGTNHTGADITCRSFFGDRAAQPQHPVLGRNIGRLRHRGLFQMH